MAEKLGTFWDTGENAALCKLTRPTDLVSWYAHLRLACFPQDLWGIVTGEEAIQPKPNRPKLKDLNDNTDTLTFAIYTFDMEQYRDQQKRVNQARGLILWSCSQAIQGFICDIPKINKPVEIIDALASICRSIISDVAARKTLASLDLKDCSTISELYVSLSQHLNTCAAFGYQYNESDLITEVLNALPLAYGSVADEYVHLSGCHRSSQLELSSADNEFYRGFRKLRASLLQSERISRRKFPSLSLHPYSPADSLYNLRRLFVELEVTEAELAKPKPEEVDGAESTTEKDWTDSDAADPELRRAERLPENPEAEPKKDEETTESTEAKIEQVRTETGGAGAELKKDEAETKSAEAEPKKAEAGTEFAGAELPPYDHREVPTVSLDSPSRRRHHCRV